jgi:hypothetical protein
VLATPARAGEPAVELDAASLKLLREAEILRGEGRFDDAERKLLALQSRAPGWAPVLFNLGLCAEASGDLKLAVERYRAFVRRASGTAADEGKMRAAYLEAKLAADRPKMRKAGYAMFGVAGLGAGLLFAGVGLGVSGKAQLEDASQPGVPPQEREAPLRRVTTGNALVWTGVGVAVVAALVGVALVVASDAKARRLRLKDMKLARHLDLRRGAIRF